MIRWREKTHAELIVLNDKELLFYADKIFDKYHTTLGLWIGQMRTIASFVDVLFAIELPMEFDMVATAMYEVTSQSQ